MRGEFGRNRSRVEVDARARMARMAVERSAATFGSGPAMGLKELVQKRPSDDRGIDMFTSCRVNKRYAIKATAKVFQGSRMLEMAIRDISVSGVGLVASDAVDLEVGSLCFVALPRFDRLNAIVVAARRQSYHMQFLAADADEMRILIDAYGGEAIAARQEQGPHARQHRAN